MRKQTNPDVDHPAEAHYRHMSLELTHAGLTTGGRVRLSVAGDSMAPLLRPGDAVWVEPAEPARLRRGDLVVVRRGSELVTHRLLAADDRGWYTKGDNRTHLDLPVGSEAILGRVVAIERRHELAERRCGTRIELRGRRWTVQNRLLGLISLWEARLFQVGRRVKRRVFGAGRQPGA